MSGRMSLAQEQLWFLQQLGDRKNVYNVPRAYRLRGTLDAEALAHALDAVVARHDVLRTRFFERDGVPMAEVVPGARVRLRRIDLSAMAEVDAQASVCALVRDAETHAFDLGAPPALIASLAKLSEREHVLVTCVHHIVSDAGSHAVFVNDLSIAYRLALQAGGPVSLPALSMQFADHARAQRERIERGERDAQIAHWQDHLGAEVPALELPLDGVRSPLPGFDGASLMFDLPAALCEELRVFCRAQRCTPFVVLLAAWQVVLSRVSGQGDFAIGVPHAGRDDEALEPLIGYCVNMQPYRVRLRPDLSLLEVCRQVRRDALAAMAHADLPLASLLARRSDPRDPARSPLFQVAFGVQMAGESALPRMGDASVELAESIGDVAKFELSLDLRVAADSVRARLEYRTDLFRAETAGRLSGWYAQVLAQLLTEPHKRLSEIDLSSQADAQLLSEWGAGEAEQAESLLAHQALEAQAAQAPEAVAVVCGEHTLSHAQLHAAAHRIAHRLIGRGVRPGDRVGVSLRRGLHLFSALLGVLKAGAAYVPLDPDYPEARLAHMRRDSATVLQLDEPLLAQWLQEAGPEHPRVAIHPEQLAYVIYTSGSTGRPKGVGVPHGALARHLAAIRRRYAMRAADRELQFASINFDIAHERWLAVLGAGGSALLWDPRDRTPAELIAHIRQHRANALFLPPAYLDEVVAALKRQRQQLDLRLCVIGGEAWRRESVQQAREVIRAEHLVNAYGPTETVIAPTAWRVHGPVEGLTAPIGRGIGPRRAQVLDADLQPVPPGVPGELHLGGACLARGYLGQPGLTAERFIADEGGARRYRSGDRVRWNAQGQLEHLGRLDHQIKVRGLRIEPAEIEAALLAQAGVSQAVVIARQQRLVAYVVGHAERAPLARELPEHLVPAVIVELAQLPLTPNGKVDRQALPEPQWQAQEHQAPQGEVEQRLATIWAEVLGLEKVGRHDHFFELGGHSLLALKLLEGIRQAGWAVQVRTLFAHPRLEAFARAIQTGQQGDVVVPANGIPREGCERIEPHMLTLIELDNSEIERIEQATPGGARNIQDIYPLAPLQQGMLFHHLMQPGRDAYVTPRLLAFDSRERLLGFVESLERVIARHDALRTAFVWQALDEPVQVVQRQARLEIEWAEALPADSQIDVGRAPLMRAIAVPPNVNEPRWRLLWVSHHLVFDHTTLEVLIREIAAIRQGREAELEAPVPYRDFVAQSRHAAGDESHQACFRARLADIDETTAPFGRQSVRHDGAAVRDARLRLSPTLSRRTCEQAQRLGVSAAALMHLAWGLVAGRTSNRREVVFGTVLFGRMQAGSGAQRAVGLFINTLPLRLSLGEASVAQGLAQAHERLSELLEHEHASLALAQACSGVSSGAPLFTSLLNYRYNDARHLDGQVQGWDGVEVLGGGERSNYPVAMSVDDLGDDGFALKAQVDASIAAPQVCSLMAAAIERVVDALEHAPHKRLSEIDLSSETDAQRLSEWGAGEAEQADALLAHHALEAQAAQAPEAVAVVCGEQTLSHAQLHAAGNRIAHRLIARGVRPGDRVGVSLRRGLHLFSALLGVLKAGAAYVPLDPDYPEARLAHMRRDSALVLQLDEPLLAQWLQEAGPEHPRVAIHPEQLAYVIYTSGSTGRPKGVGVPHGALARHLAAIRRRYAMRAADRELQFASINFDIAHERWLAVLGAGGSALLWDPRDRTPAELIAHIRQHRANALFLPPAYLDEVVAALKRQRQQLDLRLCVIGGEAWRRESVQQAREVIRAEHLVNAYGPTETVIAPTAWRVHGPVEGLTAPIGRGIGPRRAQVLDADLQPVPPGVPGELHLGGACLARGYLGQPGLTAERFIADEGGARRYRSGDRVRWNAQGQLEHLGRLDHQIKVRGLRIEPAEIEAALLAQAGVSQAVVIARQQRLVAYVVGHAERAPLARELPEHLVPAVIVELAQLPLTPNGKVDRQALPEPQWQAQEHEAPQGEVERRLATIWAEVLGLEKVGRHDHFFELGGDSIASLRVVAQAAGHGLALSPREVFEHPTIAGLACALAAEPSTSNHITGVDDSSPTPARRADAPPCLSHAQMRQWFLWCLEPDSTAYHINAGLRIEGDVDATRLAESFAALARRHDVLRTTFHAAADGGARPQVDADVRVDLGFEDLADLAEAERDERLALQTRVVTQTPFDLGARPPWRAAVIRLAPREHLLLVSMHHIVSDGWSVKVFVEELLHHYRGDTALPALPLQYADHAARQREALVGGDSQRQLAYWRAHLGEDHPVLRLPADRPRRADGRYGAARHTIGLEPVLGRRLRRCAQSQRTSVFMVLLTALQALLHRVSGEGDIRLGVPIAGRQAADTQALIGFFANTQVVRARVHGRLTFAELLAQAREATLGAQVHQDLPFEQLVEALQPERSLDATPLFQVAFNHFTADARDLHVPGWRISEHRLGGQAAQFDLSVHTSEDAEGNLRASFVYAAELFEPTTMSRLGSQFVAMLEALCADPTQAVGDVSLIDAASLVQLQSWGGERDTTVTTTDEPWAHAAIQAQARATPHALAVIDEGASLTYAELNHRANRLAHHLIGQGVRPDDRIGVALPSRPQRIVALLAVLKAGAAYLPLDLQLPTERLAACLDESRARLLIGEGDSLQTLLGACTARLIALDLDTAPLDAQPEHDPGVPLQRHHLAYTLYTSGSTGRPKGVDVPHGALAMHLQAIDRVYGLTDRDRLLQFAAIGFDAAGEQWMLPLLRGAALVLRPEDASLHAVRQRLIEHRVSVLYMPPAYLQPLLESLGTQKLPHVRLLIAGGEAWPQAACRQALRTLGIERAVNAYGPTETVITPTAYTVHAGTEEDTRSPHVPIGRPVGRRRAWLLDAELNPVPIGVSGELHLGGEGLARGYLGQPGLTAERFIADEGGTRRYRSGDLARWNAPGQLQYLGRNDHQIKLRGQRIEPGEIEAQLLAQPGVSQAVVILREQQLIAYVVCEPGRDTTELQAALERRLPEAMLPSAIVALDRLPLTPNGKVDRRALPEPQQPAREHEDPQGEVERRLATIWAEVLGLDQVGRHDHFFELGGHSLLALKLLEDIRQAGWAVQVRTLFSHPRLEAFARAIQTGQQGDVAVPANGIPTEGCERIEPHMLTLIELDNSEIERIEQATPGGARNIQDIYPLAPLQQGMLFHHQMNPRRDVYVAPIRLSFDTRERLQAFVALYDRVIARHDILRTAFVWEGVREPVQVVHRHASLHLEWADAPEPHPQIDVTCAPLVRALACPSGERWLLQLASHHLVTDHASLETLAHELTLLQQGRDAELGASVAYREFVARVRRGPDDASHRAYFTRRLADIDEPTAPFGLLDTQGDGRELSEAAEVLPTVLSHSLRREARRNGASVAALVHLAWALVLARTCGRSDVVFGTVLSGRLQAGRDAGRAVGLFINTLPMRVSIGAEGIARCLRNAHDDLNELLDHEHAGLTLAQACSGVRQGAPLFSSLLNFRHARAQRSALAWGGIEPLAAGETSNYPLGMAVDDFDDGRLRVKAEAPPAIGAARVCALMREALSAIAKALRDAPERAACTLGIVSGDEARRLFDWGRNPVERYAPFVHGLVEQRARLVPDAVALAMGEARLSYAQLNARANRLAHQLIARGVRPEAKVGIALTRSMDMVVALLAVLKAGGAYVPLDPSYPAERLAYMAHDSGIGWWLTASAPTPTPAMPGVEPVALDALPFDGPSHDPCVPMHPQQLAYVIYTSGSTGRPKGVAVAHGPLAMHVQSIGRAYGMTPEDRELQFASINFDGAHERIWVPLAFGATLVPRDDELWSAQRTRDEIVRHGITVACFTPGYLLQLAEHLGAAGRDLPIRSYTVGGEPTTRAAFDKIQSGLEPPRLINGYGPTETVVTPTISKAMPGTRVDTACMPIGRPVGNRVAYVLDATLNLVPAGVAGELYLGGEGLARGYLGRPGLSAERFVADPFSADGKRLYRTGDLARWRDDGELDCLGRIDHQVKVRGFRIEPGEVETQLLAQPEVREAVAVARDEQLVAYVALGAPIATAALRERLAGVLPGYMVPAAIVVLEALPLSPNGKVDRAALPEPRFDSTLACEAPQGEIEVRLAPRLAGVLKVAQLGRHDDFFELGAHSLTLLSLQAQVQSACGRTLPLRDFFEHTTLARLARRVADDTAADTTAANDGEALQRMSALLDLLETE